MGHYHAVGIRRGGCATEQFCLCVGTHSKLTCLEDNYAHRLIYLRAGFNNGVQHLLGVIESKAY